MKKIKIKELGKIISGGTPSTANENFWDGELIWITPKDLSKNKSKYIFNGERNITQDGLEHSSAKLLPVNSVLLSSRAPIGYLAIAGCELTTNQGFKSIICDESIVLPEYLYYSLSTKIADLISISYGSTFLELSKSSFENFELSIHSIQEQQHIVDTIGSIDDLIENLNKQNSQLNKLISKLFIKYTKNIDKIKIGECSGYSIIKSGINYFDSTKIYLDTASVDDDNIISKDYIITINEKPSRANMQPIPNSVCKTKR